MIKTFDRNWKILLILFFLLFIFISLNPSYFVSAGQRALVYNVLSGKVSKTKAPGFHFKIPFVEDIVKYEVRRRPYDIKTVASSKDIQDINLSLRFLYAPIEEELSSVYYKLGRNYEYAEKIFPSICKEVLKAVVAQYTAAEVIEKRAEVRDHIEREIIERAKKSWIKVFEVAITDIDFSDKFEQAVEDKQVAEQKKIQAELEADATITRARGEAEAARIINEASSSSPAFIKLREIEARKHVAAQMAKSKNTKIIYVPNNLMIMSDNN